MTIQVLILLAGLLIYAGYGIYGLGWLAAAVLVTYLAGLALPKHKWLLWPVIVVNAVLLITIKLQPVTGFGILAPFGVSYFTLQMISYLADVRKEKYPPERSLLTFALYLTYFPHLVMGPIESFDHMKQALAERKITWDGISSGAVRAIWGAFKMYAVSARAGVVVGTISTSPEEYRGAYALFAMLLYSIELYADFSGCMDIVLGISKMLGIRMSENFNTPYFSQTVAEFWRRWHITLGDWLRNYIYIPLGGSRRGKVRKVVNLIVTFLVSGLWHGVHYILWGVFNGILVATGNLLKTKYRVLNCAITYLLISILWSFFIWPDSLTALRSIASLFTTFNYGDLVANIFSLGLNAGEWIAFVISLLLLFIYDLKKESLTERFDQFAPAVRVVVFGTLTLLVLVFGMYGIGFEAEQFIYASF
ncbi:MAG: hypothetical protein LUI10_09435 [Lachnospiraceae bacterium]|nr:hypothetical protein [Lachnospiraceae bacterium]